MLVTFLLEFMFAIIGVQLFKVRALLILFIIIIIIIMWLVHLTLPVVQRAPSMRVDSGQTQ